MTQDIPDNMRSIRLPERRDQSRSQSVQMKMHIDMIREMHMKMIQCAGTFGMISLGMREIHFQYRAIRMTHNKEVRMKGIVRLVRFH